MNYLKNPPITQFKMQCPKKTRRREQFLHSDKDMFSKVCTFLLQINGKDDKERIPKIGQQMENVVNMSNTSLVYGTLKLSPDLFYKI